MRFDANRIGMTDYIDRGLTWLKELHKLEYEIARPRDVAVVEKNLPGNIKKMNDLLETGFKGDKSHDITRREELIPAVRLLEDLWMKNMDVFKDTEYFNACMTSVTTFTVFFGGGTGKVYDHSQDVYIISGDGSYEIMSTYQCSACEWRFSMLGKPDYCPRCGVKVKDCVDAQDLVKEKLMSKLFDHSPSLAFRLRDAINDLDRKEGSNARASHGESSACTVDVTDDYIDELLTGFPGNVQR